MRDPLTNRLIFTSWWPLALSWLFMSLEFPALVAVISRMPDSTINLAAFGGVVFPIALFIEAPIMMFLPASTALCRHSQRYRLVRKMVLLSVVGLTAVHILVCVPPVFNFITDVVFGVPKELKEPAWLGLVLIIPWTGAIAIRRFYQGILIRSGRSRLIGMGTFIRFLCTFSTLMLGFSFLEIHAAAVAALSLSVGAVAEGFFAWAVSRSSVHKLLDVKARKNDLLSVGDFFRFYVPLAMSTILFLCTSPIASASMARMPLTISSLAVWPALNGFLFLFRSFGIAMKEVVISLSSDNEASLKLLRFSLVVGSCASGALFLIAVSPLSSLLFEGLYALKPDLAELGQSTLVLLAPIPFLAGLVSWYMGEFTVREETRKITFGVLVFVVVMSIVLMSGIAAGDFPGIMVFAVAMLAAHCAQLLFFWYSFKSSDPIKRDQAIAAQALGDDQAELGQP